MILLIDNYDSFTYNLYQLISELTSAVKVVRNDATTLTAIRQLLPNGIVLSPGPGKPENAGICVAVIRAFANEIPIFGVCLGLQAIAVAFGAQVVKAKQLMHGKSSSVFHNLSTLYEEIPLPFIAGRYHSLIVEKSTLHAILRIEAETADETIMGLKHVDHPIYGVQFHPESILSEHGEHIIKNFISICKETV